MSDTECKRLQKKDYLLITQMQKAAKKRLPEMHIPPQRGHLTTPLQSCWLQELRWICLCLSSISLITINIITFPLILTKIANTNNNSLRSFTRIILFLSFLTVTISLTISEIVEYMVMIWIDNDSTNLSILHKISLVWHPLFVILFSIRSVTIPYLQKPNYKEYFIKKAEMLENLGSKTSANDVSDISPIEEINCSKIDYILTFIKLNRKNDEKKDRNKPFLCFVVFFAIFLQLFWINGFKIMKDNCINNDTKSNIEFKYVFIGIWVCFIALFIYLILEWIKYKNKRNYEMQLKPHTSETDSNSNTPNTTSSSDIEVQVNGNNER